VSAASRVESAVADLSESLGARLTRATSVCEQHGRDEGWHDPSPPDAVVFAESTADVVAVLRTCARHSVPVIPFGAGTSLEGHVAALSGGISLDLTRMNRVLRVSSDDLDCTVEAGVTRKQLNDYVNDQGVFFPIDPGADATLGGMAATRASGTNAVRYGTMRDNVLGLTAVLASGEVVHTGTRARKSSAGYDLTRLIVGSEGTLAVVTEVTLRLFGIPEAISSAVCAFDSLGGAIQTVIETIQLGIPVARIELLDETQVRACNGYSDLDLSEVPTLFLEFHGSPASVVEQSSEVEGLAREHGGHGWSRASDPSEREKLWRARHEAYYAALSLRPGCKGFPTDVCVPISRLAECILETRRDIGESGLVAPIVGHVGDGNFHVLFLVDPDDPDELDRVKRLNDRLIARTLELDGTCTGEHGVGYGKLPYLEAEHGTPAIEVMRALKRALDPAGILNPGKVVP
jgi:D-lactate dehydrogenase (cytochrome)